ncbi:MAG: TrmB family transcriptional regulator [Candidatus Heimdallarchaeota archaeon]
MQIDEKLIEGLTKIGLQRYQAQVYIASVVLGEATPYLIAKESGVPRAKVYSVLDSLIELGFMVKVPAEKGTLFKSLPPEATIDNAMNSFVSTFNDIKKDIKELQEVGPRKSGELPIIVFNSLLTMIEEGNYSEAWIDKRLEITYDLLSALNKKKCKINEISSNPPMSFIYGDTEAFFIKGTNGSLTMIKFSNNIIQQILTLIRDEDSIVSQESDTGVRILRETAIISLEDRLKTVVPGYNLQTEPVLFWGKIDRITGSFESEMPADCFVTESRLLIGTDDGRVWARTLKFINKISHKKGNVTLIFQKVGGTEAITISSSAYSTIIAELIRKLKEWMK